MLPTLKTSKPAVKSLAFSLYKEYILEIRGLSLSNIEQGMNKKKEINDTNA